MDVIYKLNGTDLKTYGVYISGSEGLLSRPKPKKPVSANWETEHGEVVDLSKRYYEAREIQLECFIKAASQWDFQDKCNTLLNVFDTPGTKRLQVEVDNLSVGENLLTRTNSDYSKWFNLEAWTVENGCLKATNTDTGANSNYFDTSVNKTFTVSFSVVQMNGVFRLHNVSSFDILVPAVVGKFKYTFTVGSNVTSNHVVIYGTGSGTALIKDFKVEVGSNATDWCPAKNEFKPLVYEVYLDDSIDIKKIWNEKTMVGTFTLKLREPEPIKKVIKFTGIYGFIRFTCNKPLNIYWGDSLSNFDVFGEDAEFEHDYDVDSVYYAIITGDIDSMTISQITGGEVIWNKL